MLVLNKKDYRNSESPEAENASAWLRSHSDRQGTKGKGYPAMRDADFEVTFPLQGATKHLLLTWGKTGSSFVLPSKLSRAESPLQQGLVLPELPSSATTMLNKCICFLQFPGRLLNISYMVMMRSGMPLCNPMVSHPNRAQLQVICSPLNHIF